jgi:hypothetical protein
VVWDEVNQWRSAMGLPLIGSTGTGAKNFAPIYEHDYMLLFSDAVAVGARKDGPSRLMPQRLSRPSRKTTRTSRTKP